MDETEGDEPKVWKIEKADDQLAITSGADLLDKLKASGTGEDKIVYALSFFEKDEDTGEFSDVPAKKLAKKFFHPEPGVVVSDLTKKKVKDFVEKGEWKEEPVPRTDPSSLLTRVKRIGKPEKKADERKAAK